MSYYVEYHPELTNKYPFSSKKGHTALGRILIAIALTAITFCLFAQKNVRDFLIPGDPDTTVKATAELVEDIKNGSTLLDALTAFCETVTDFETVKP